MYNSTLLKWKKSKENLTKIVKLRKNTQNSQKFIKIFKHFLNFVKFMFKGCISAHCEIFISDRLSTDNTQQLETRNRGDQTRPASSNNSAVH